MPDKVRSEGHFDFRTSVTPLKGREEMYSAMFFLYLSQNLGKYANVFLVMFSKTFSGNWVN